MGSSNLTRSLSDIGMDDEGGLLPNERRATIEQLITARSGVYHPEES